LKLTWTLHQPLASGAATEAAPRCFEFRCCGEANNHGNHNNHSNQTQHGGNMGTGRPETTGMGNQMAMTNNP